MDFSAFQLVWRERGKVDAAGSGVERLAALLHFFPRRLDALVQFIERHVDPSRERNGLTCLHERVFVSQQARQCQWECHHSQEWCRCARENEQDTKPEEPGVPSANHLPSRELGVRCRMCERHLAQHQQKVNGTADR